MIGHVGQAGQHVLEISVGINAPPPTAFDDGVNDGSSDAAARSRSASHLLSGGVLARAASWIANSDAHGAKMFKLFKLFSRKIFTPRVHTRDAVFPRANPRHPSTSRALVVLN